MPNITNSSFYWLILRRHLLLLRFILRSIYISWVLFTDCTKGPRGPSLCWSSVPWIESSIRILDRNVHLLTLACKASSSCVWLTRANILLQRCIVKAKKKCFFHPQGGPQFGETQISAILSILTHDVTQSGDEIRSGHAAETCSLQCKVQ